MNNEQKIKEFYEKYPFPNEGVSLNLEKHSWILNSIPNNLIKEKKDLKILDAGCGTGEISSYLSQFGKVTGIDFSENSIEIAKKNCGNVRFIVDDLDDLKHKEKYDFIFCMAVLHHIPNINKALQNLKKLLKKDSESFLIVSVANKYALNTNKLILWLKYKLGRLSYTRYIDAIKCPYMNSYSQKEFEQVLIDNGFEVVGMWRKMPEWLRFLTGKGVIMSFCVVEKESKI